MIVPLFNILSLLLGCIEHGFNISFPCPWHRVMSEVITHTHLSELIMRTTFRMEKQLVNYFVNVHVKTLIMCSSLTAIITEEQLVDDLPLTVSCKTPEGHGLLWQTDFY